MHSLYADLEWLPRTPETFSQDLKALETAAGPLGTQLRALASTALDLGQLHKLARAMKRAQAAGKSLAPLTPFRLAVLSNSTLDMLAPALIATALSHGFALELIQPAYDQVAQEALTPSSRINTSNPDAVLFALDYRALPLELTLLDQDATRATVQRSIDYLQSLRQGIRSASNAVCLFQTFALPPEDLFGSIDRGLPGTLRNVLYELNRELSSALLNSGDVLLDIASLAETVGTANWHDTRLWNLAKLSFSDRFVPLYADHVARTLAALRGKSRKALVLDLDNTLWGGVIGDDGLEGIRIAQGDAIGEAHLSLQRYALDLRRRGIVLAVSSKNTDATARTPFEQHPEMLLRLEHIAVFQANWNDKATNLQAIAHELNLGLDALVFLDDNPAERDLVRQLLPEVAVPELPEEPAYYTRTLAAAGYFEAISIAPEDLSRAGFYQDNARRLTLQQELGGVDAWLASLDMTITFQPFDAPGRARIAQLINKSNQYNLTTRRYTEPEIEAAERDPNVFTLQVRLADIFGDNGMISVLIARPAEPGTWHIDTWLMSCRVLGRRVEHMVLRELLLHARAAGIHTLYGAYKPTGRNHLVADHYAKLGFTHISGEAGSETRWSLSTEAPAPDPSPMKVASNF